MKDNRKKQMRPNSGMAPIPYKDGILLFNAYQNKEGFWARGTQVRPGCPTDEYRHLLSPETRARLEAMEGK